MAVGDPGVRTAPAFTAAAGKRVITLHFIDRSGDQYAEDWQVPVAETAADIEAWAAAYAASSQASLWAITDRQERIGQMVATNGNNDNRSSVASGVNILFGNTATFVSRTLRVVAPVLAAMSGDSDTPILTAVPLSALVTAAAAVAAAGDYADSAQYTKHRERKNVRVQI